MSVDTKLNLTMQLDEKNTKAVLDFLEERLSLAEKHPSGSVKVDGATIELTTADSIRYADGDVYGAGMGNLKELLLQIEHIAPELRCQGVWSVFFETSGGTDDWSFEWESGELRNVVNKSEEGFIEALDNMSMVKAKAPGLIEEILEDECMFDFIYAEGHDLSMVLDSLVEEGNDGDERSQDLARRLAEALDVDISWATGDWDD